jgi:hypothetical protein
MLSMSIMSSLRQRQPRRLRPIRMPVTTWAPQRLWALPILMLVTTWARRKAMP